MITRSLLLAATLAAACVSSFAAPALTRAEVRAEMKELRAAGALLPVGEASPSQLEANVIDRRIALLQVADQSEDAADIAPESLMFVSPTGTVILIEPLPDGDAPAPARR